MQNQNKTGLIALILALVFSGFISTPTHYRNVKPEAAASSVHEVTDDFSGDESKWQFVRGYWDATGGWFERESVNDREVVVLSDVYHYTEEITIQADGQLNSSFEEIGIVFGFKSYKDFYVALINPDAASDRDAELYKMQNGSLSEIADAAFTSSTSAVYVLKVIWNPANGDIAFYVDDSLKISHTDTTHETGNVGLWGTRTGGSSNRYDNWSSSGVGISQENVSGFAGYQAAASDSGEDGTNRGFDSGYSMRCTGSGYVRYLFWDTGTATLNMATGSNQTAAVYANRQSDSAVRIGYAGNGINGTQVPGTNTYYWDVGRFWVADGMDYLFYFEVNDTSWDVYVITSQSATIKRNTQSPNGVADTLMTPGTTTVTTDGNFRAWLTDDVNDDGT